MENASKALIIAGSILLGIILVTMAVFIFSSAGKVSQQYEEKLSSDKLNEYNNRYEMYCKDLNAQDMVSLINMTKQLNSNYDGIPDRKVEIVVSGSTIDVDNFGETQKINLMKQETGSSTSSTFQYLHAEYYNSGLINKIYYNKVSH